MAAAVAWRAAWACSGGTTEASPASRSSTETRSDTNLVIAVRTSGAPGRTAGTGSTGPSGAWVRRRAASVSPMRRCVLLGILLALTAAPAHAAVKKGPAGTTFYAPKAKLVKGAHG